MMTRWTEEQNAGMRRLYAEGRTWPEIARAFGIARGAAIAHGHRIGRNNSRDWRGAALQRPPEPAMDPVPPYVAVLTNSKAPQRSEGGHPLPAGDPLTWSLVICNTRTLDDQPWPEAGV